MTLDELAAALDDTANTSEDHATFVMYTSVSRAAAAELAKLGAAALPVLVPRLESAVRIQIPEPCYDQGMYIGNYAERYETVAANAAVAIAEIGAAAVGVLPAVVDAWWRQTGDARESCRLAVLALCRHATAAGTAAALVALAGDPDRVRRRDTARQLASYGAPAYEACCTLAADPDAEIRQLAIAALGEVADPAELPARLLPLLAGPDASSHWASACALAKRAPKAVALQVIADDLAGADPKWPVIEAAARFPEEAARLVPLLRAALARETHAWRRKTLETAIAKLRSPSAS